MPKLFKFIRKQLPHASTSPTPTHTFVKYTPQEESIEAYELRDYFAMALCRNKTRCEIGVDYQSQPQTNRLNRAALNQFSQRYIAELAAPLETVKQIYSDDHLYSRWCGKVIANESNHEQAEKFFRQHLIAIYVEVMDEKKHKWVTSYVYTNEALKVEEKGEDWLGGRPMQCRIS